MGEYHMPMETAFYHTDVRIALALQVASQERRGQKPGGIDYAENAGDRAVEKLEQKK
jgi:hypothetical protein